MAKNENENHLMIDFETLDVGSMPVLLSVGAVVFNPYKEQPFIDFERSIDIQSCIDLGGTISGSTIKWWMGQSAEARNKITNPTTVQGTAKEVFVSIAAFCKEHKVKKVWGQGANFDPVICDNYYKALGIKSPWLYYNVRDTRTLFDLTGITRTPIAIKHSALEDARGQAIDVMRCCMGFKNLVERMKDVEKGTNS
jgi:hypothetical protein